MKTRNARVLFGLLLTVSLLVVLTPAQQPALLDDEGQIKQWRSDIEAMIENRPRPGSRAEADYLVSLTSLRKKLRDLLVEKRGAIKSKIINLKSRSTKEIQSYVAALETELQDVSSEVAALDQAVGGNVIVALVPTHKPSPAPAPTEEQKAFETVVKNLAVSDLKKAAAPDAVVESTLPQPGCTGDGDPNIALPSKYDIAICELAANINERKTRRILLSGDKGDLLPILIAKLLKTNGDESFVALVTEAQERRTDQQVGAGPNSTGTTSLVVKGGVPYFLGLAVENGGAVESRSDTTVTFRLNPAGVLNMFEKKGFITGFREAEKDPVMNFLRKTSVGLTFDTNRGNQPGVFTGDKQQLSAVSARVEFVNERDPRLKKYETEWEKFMADEGIKLAQQIYATTLSINSFGTSDSPESFNDPALQAWLVQTNQQIAIVDTSGPDVERINEYAKILRERADLLPVDLVRPETVSSISSFGRQFLAYAKKKNEILDKIAKGRIFTLEYNNKREVNAPDTSNFNFIAASGAGRRIDLTANGSLTFFHSRSLTSSDGPRTNRIRDFQFAGQVDIPFKVGEGQFEFWFSGRYERLLENAALATGVVAPHTKGDIAVGQFGLNIPVRGLGMKFPVSVTFANRTELVKEKTIRGNFGFTFNWDTLWSKLKPF